MQPDDVRRLLDRLASHLGFRLSDTARARLERMRASDPDEFTRDLLDAAGIDPAGADARLLEQLRARVVESMRGPRHPG
ncbi:MAG: hypothetical protein O9284_04690 [Steroidobacteraceae bacterium]|nr:hypothetical protein [Steroidobacteraceae bacterium]